MDIFLIIWGYFVCWPVGRLFLLYYRSPVSYVGLLLLHFTDKIHFSTTHLILWAFWSLLSR